MMTHRSGYLLFVGTPEPRICTCTFYSPVLSGFSFEDGCAADHRLPFGKGDYLLYLAHELPVHFGFPRALPIWLFRGRLCFAEHGRLRWQMIDVHRAYRSLERGSFASASRATARDGLRGAGKRVVQFLYGGRYLLMGAALTTLVSSSGSLLSSDESSSDLSASGSGTTLFPVLAPPKLSPPGPKAPPRHMLHSFQQSHLSAHPPRSAHAVPILTPPKRSPGSPVKTCSRRFSWVAASDARVARFLPLVTVFLGTASPASAVGCHIMA